MITRTPVVITSPLVAKQELRSLGLTVEFVENVAREVASAKADATPLHPRNSPGMLGYIFGVGSIRRQLVPQGWRLSRDGNIESTVNDTLGIQLFFQNVDCACGNNDPHAISPKGASARDLIRDGLQGELFVREEDNRASVPRGAVPVVWVVCVSFDGKNLRAEVSCPNEFDGSQFDVFSKRIFVVNETLETPNPNKDHDDGASDYEVKIARR